MTVLRISSVCLGALVSALLASSFAFSQERPVVNGILGPPSPGTCFWTDRAFKDIPERGPAEAAGLSSGDLITAVDRQAVSSASALQPIIGAHKPGDRISITYVDTGGQTHTVDVTLASGPPQ